jgi:hypothetical protein
MRPLRGELPFLAPLRFGTEMQEEGEGWRSYGNTGTYKISVNACLFESYLGCGSGCSIGVPDVRKSQSYQGSRSQADF